MVATKNILDKKAEEYAIKAQKAVGKYEKGIVSTQVLALLAAVGDEFDKHLEMEKSIIEAIIEILNNLYKYHGKMNPEDYMELANRLNDLHKKARNE